MRLRVVRQFPLSIAGIVDEEDDNYCYEDEKNSRAFTLHWSKYDEKNGPRY